jgi:NAD(P)-dependent dehydrogenase (short-subunit alcohol dehydrogenase family)
MTQFDGKVVMVTGGGGGIGGQCVSRFLDAGAYVVLLDRNPPVSETVLAKMSSDRLLTLQGDVSVAEDVKACVETAVQRFGGLDYGINCAGISGTNTPLLEEPDDAMDRLLAINVRGTFLSMKYQLLAIKATGRGGAIVNAASVFAFRSFETFGLYSASKHAVAGLTKGAAVEMATSGIRVNAIAPGPIYTPFMGDLPEEGMAWAIQSVPMNRLGEPDDVAGVVTWLCSEDARFVTGAILSVDGGINAKMYSGGGFSVGT